MMWWTCDSQCAYPKCIGFHIYHVLCQSALYRILSKLSVPLTDDILHLSQNEFTIEVLPYGDRKSMNIRYVFSAKVTLTCWRVSFAKMQVTCVNRKHWIRWKAAAFSKWPENIFVLFFHDVSGYILSYVGLRKHTPFYAGHNDIELIIVSIRQKIWPYQSRLACRVRT